MGELRVIQAKRRRLCFSVFNGYCRIVEIEGSEVEFVSWAYLDFHNSAAKGLTWEHGLGGPRRLTHEHHLLQ